MSAGDPIIRLLKGLTTYWRKSFSVTAPALRKQGYRSLPALEKHIASFKNSSREKVYDPDAHGERIDGIKGFREAAKVLKGSRDIGAQLFTALLRRIGIEARLVASLQPIGFGWSKNEEASLKREKGAASSTGKSQASFSSSDDDESDDTRNSPSRPRKKTADVLHNSKAKFSEDEDSDDSVIEVTPRTPTKKSSRQFDRDLQVPNYWTEVVSPITFQIYPVDSIVSKIPVITSAEYLPYFEPRGARADKAKQVFAYVIAFSPDGTAKDVTTRYLKRHTWPGRTKGVRMPIEKVPLYNRNGKIKKHEEYDWFKTVMSGYERPHLKANCCRRSRRGKRPEARKDRKKGSERSRGYIAVLPKLLLNLFSNDIYVAKRPSNQQSKPVRTFTSGQGQRCEGRACFQKTGC